MEPVVVLTTLVGFLLDFIWREIKDNALSTAKGYIKDKGNKLYEKLKNNEKLLREFKKFSYDYYKDEMQGIEFAERFYFTGVNEFVKEHKDEFIKLYLDCEDRKAEKERLLDLLSKEVSPDENLRIYFDCVLNFFADYIKDSMPDTFKWVYTNIKNTMSEQFEITNANIAELKEQTAKIYAKIPVTQQLIRTGDIKPTAYKGSNSDRYICRPTITNEIAGKLADNNLVFLWSEVAGLGKSETAREYAMEYKGSYSIMQIVTNENNESLKDTIAKISYDGDSEDRSIDVKYHRIIRLLSSDEKKLIIVDNYNPKNFEDDNEVIQSLADIANCDFVFTTRTKSDEYNYVDIPQLSEDDLCKVFLSIAKNEDESKVRELIRTVNNHTLVVVLVAGMISRWSQRNKKNLDDYIEEIKSNNDRIGNLNNKVLHRGKIAIPFEHIKSLFNLAGLNDMERYVMKNACLLPVSGMNFREFNNMISKIFEYSDIKQFLQSVQETDTSELVENEELLEILEFFNSTDESEIKNELNEFNEENNYTDVLDTLIQCNWLKEVSGNVSLHPLIAEVIEEELKPTSDDCENYIDNLFAEIDECYEKDYGKAYSYIEVAKGMADYFLRSGEKTENTGYLFNNVGYLCNAFADYELAIKYYEKSIAIREDVLESNHPDLASTYNNLGLAYNNKGDYDKAIEYISKALGILEKAYKDNPNYPYLAGAYNNLVGVYINKGEYDKAIEYYSKALGIVEIAYKDNPNHPDLATSYN
ncbi:MAG: tetratricopeptide repeat protein, partial [Ruminococcus sp.]|nr:tetratricopeptide repeat protein [Ruminococcus sp.]